MKLPPLVTHLNKHHHPHLAAVRHVKRDGVWVCLECDRA